MSEKELTPEPENSDPVDESNESIAESVEMETTPSPITEADGEYEGVDEWSAPPLSDEWLSTDIDAALAAVASLSEMMPEREAEEQARADSVQTEPTFIPQMTMPPLATLRRGQLGSVVPALLLIGVGAWLTLTLTAGTPPDPLLVALVIFGGVVASLLAQWLSSRRWSRGALFFALVMLFGAGVVVFAIQPGNLDLPLWYPLLAVAGGVALILSGLLARPVNTRLFLPGVLAALAGVAGLTVTLGLIPDNMMAAAVPLAPFALVAMVILLLLPLIFRRRQSATP